jgi:transposase
LIKWNAFLHQNYREKRQRILKYLEENNDKKKANQLFQVGIATIYRRIKRKKQKGNEEPLKKKSSYKKIEDQK